MKKKAYRTMKVLDIDLDFEQSIRIKSGDAQFLIYKIYGRKGHCDALKRQHQRRINKGICTVAGCIQKAQYPFKKCKIHRELERISGKIRRREKHEQKTHKI
jgi:hypothetical protein